MDEIAAVKLFRDEVPARDDDAREAVRRRIETALAHTNPRLRSRAWRSRRLWVLVGAALLGAAIVSSALGWTGRLIDVIAGEPAPPRVKRAFAVQNEARARQLMPIFRSAASGNTVVERTHGVIGINSSAGSVVIWAAPTKGGGVCWLLDIERLRQPNGLPNGGAGCIPGPEEPSVPLTFGLRRTRVADDYLTLIEGRAGADVASIELQYADGEHETLPIFERFFLHEPRAGSRPTLLVARDRSGAEIKRQPIRSFEATRPRPRPPQALRAGRVLIRFETDWGFPLTFGVAPAENGQLCQTTRYRGAVAGTCGPDPRDRLAPDEIGIHPGLWNEAEDGKPLVTLNGAVGSAIARLELHYTDGTNVSVPITERFVLFEIPPARHKDERFVLVGRSRAGAEIARRTIK